MLAPFTFASAFTAVVSVVPSLLAVPLAYPTDCAVRLDSSKNGGKPTIATGTIVFRTDNDVRYLVTSYHCLDGTDAVTVLSSESGQKRKLSDLVEKSFLCSPVSDLCVFKLTPKGIAHLTANGCRPAKLAETATPAGTFVVAVGNPVIEMGGMERYPFSWASGATVNQTGSFGQRVGDKFAVGEARLTQVAMLESLQITKGFSGGPVLRSATNFTADDREVVGIIQGGDPKGGKLSWCIAAEQLVKLLDGGNDQWETYPPTGNWKPRLFKSDAYSRTSEKLVLGFPLNFVRRDKISQTLGQNMDTKITISENGRLDATTNTWATRNVGFTGEVIVFLCDGSGNVLWRTKNRHTFGLSLLNMDRTNTWDEQVPPEVLARVSMCLIHHQASPKQFEDALGLATIRLGDSEVRILKDLLKAEVVPWLRSGSK